MKFGQLFEYYKKLFFKNHAENEARKLVSDLFLFPKRALYELKTNDFHLSFNIHREIAFNMTFNKNKYFNTIDQEICSV